MCGRFTLTLKSEDLQEFFPLFDSVAWTPRYNIAPTQLVAALRQKAADHPPEAALLRWGLIPSWSKDAKGGFKLINARADGVATKPSFRSAFKQRRCVILADGYYEWEKGGKVKKPFHIHRPNREPFAMAGLWEFWRDDQKAIESCTIITTEANEALRSIHDRMPVILGERDFERWLDPRPGDPERLLELLQPAPSDALIPTPVGTHVNNVKNDDPGCLDGTSDQPSLFG